ncbi:MAG: adenosylcobinamide-GDP ribazoletransferase [Sphaerochaetaceae bacterium]
MSGIGLSSALRTLTRFPFPGAEPRHVSTSLYWFPVVGALYGLCDLLLFFLPFPLPVRSALVLAWTAWMSRGFHWDGLCDTFDGFGGGYTREKRLEIMKDSHVGSFGMLALSVTLLLQYALYQAVGEDAAVLFVAPVLGRTMQVLLCVALPYARENGTAGDLVRGAKERHLLGAFGICAVLLWVWGRKVVAAMALAALVCTLLVSRVSRRKIGGVTGDVLGAGEVLGETASLLGALVFLAVNGNTW